MSTVGDERPGRSGQGHASQGARGKEPWWKCAAIYQVYLRSFAGSRPSGTGDIEGCRSRLAYLADLGVDAIWFNPWYLSPMADGGYDVTDYRQIDPQFGTIADAERLIRDAHQLGIRVVLDIVPNHCSDRHPWFQEALAAPVGSPERGRFHFRPGRGDRGELPPNNWRSEFGGPAWTRAVGPDGAPGDWYLHIFAPEQPDFNWDNPEVREEFESVLRFWFDRGADGFRVDSAALLAKASGLPDLEDAEGATNGASNGGGSGGHRHPFVDRDEVHEIYRAWRRIADSYEDKRLLIGEVWLPDAERFGMYLRSDELHSAFNFEFLCCAFEAEAMRKVVDSTLASHERLGAVPTWVLSNHDVVRHVTRYGRASTAFQMGDRRIGEPSDLELGTRRARAAALVSLSLPGAVYVYQGEELGLWEVEDIPEELLRDPMWQRSGHTDRGRDGCRVPLPWSGRRPPFGFGPAGTVPWLPQPDGWATLTAEAQRDDPSSMLQLYRRALAVRRSDPAFRSGKFCWEPSPPSTLSYRRGADLVVLANMSEHAVELPAGYEVLLASSPLPEAATVTTVTTTAGTVGASSASVRGGRQGAPSQLRSPRQPATLMVPPDTAVWARAAAGALDATTSLERP